MKSFREYLNEGTKFDVVSFVMGYEGGELSDDEIIKGFSELTKSGLVWKLQGSYGRTAQDLIDAGYLTKKGKILKVHTNEAIRKYKVGDKINYYERDAKIIKIIRNGTHLILKFNDDGEEIGIDIDELE